MDREANLTQTVLKALDVLECLSSADQCLNVTEVAQECGLSRPTTYRLLATLQSRNYVRQTQDGHYDLGTNVLSLSKSYLEHLDLPELARPILCELSRVSNETTHLGILDDTSILYVGKVESPQTVRLHSAIGARKPVYSTAMGKAILAFLPIETRNTLLDRMNFLPHTPNTITDRAVLTEHLERICAEGFAIDDAESEEGIRCVAAPIFSLDGSAFAAISISGPAYRLSIPKLMELSESVVKAANDVSRQLGYVP